MTIGIAEAGGATMMTMIVDDEVGSATRMTMTTNADDGVGGVTTMMTTTIAEDGVADAARTTETARGVRSKKRERLKGR
jgi:hypothetical protein